MSAAPVIAIVDDDESVRAGLASLLRSVGFELVVYASAEEFLAAGVLRHIRCLILDWRMPGMDGLELQRHLAAQGVAIPILFLTAHGNEDRRASALQAGASAFLAKPVDGEILLAALNEALSDPNRTARHRGGPHGN